jgi:hypothetical protein
VPAADAFHKAKTAARQALQIDPELDEGYASLAHVRLHDWDWAGLEQNFTRSIEFSPGHAVAHCWYAERYRGRYVSPYNIARIYGSLAEPVRALERVDAADWVVSLMTN